MDYKKFDELYKEIKESSIYKKYFQCDKGRLMDLTNRKNFRYNWLKWIKLEFNDDTKSKIGKKFLEEHYIGIQIYPYFIDCEDIRYNENKNYSCNDNFPYTKREYHYISGNEISGMDIDSKTGNIMKKDNRNDIQIMYYKDYKLAKLKDDSLGLIIKKENGVIDFKDVKSQYLELMRKMIISDKPIDVEDHKSVLDKIEFMIEN